MEKNAALGSKIDDELPAAVGRRNRTIERPERLLTYYAGPHTPPPTSSLECKAEERRKMRRRGGIWGRRACTARRGS